MLLVVIGASFLSLGAAISFALSWLFGHLDTQLSLILYLFSIFLTFSGLMIIVVGAHRVHHVRTRFDFLGGRPMAGIRSAERNVRTKA